MPALTTLLIDLDKDCPSPRLAKILCSVGSAPALESISIEHTYWYYIEHLPSEDPWVDVDMWLSRIAKANGGLALTLTGWPEGKSVWEGFLPELRFFRYSSLPLLCPRYTEMTSIRVLQNVRMQSRPANTPSR
jgi:hypothetical protein